MNTRAGIGLLLALGAAACEAPFEPPVGALRVTVTTVGSDLDPDGYSLTIDNGAAQAIPVNVVDTIPTLGFGDHQVALTGLAINCTLSGSPSRTVRVGTGIATVTFSVFCRTYVGNLRVTTATTGADVDTDGFFFAVDGGANQPIPSNGFVDLIGLAVGPHQVVLSGIAGNCAAASNPESVVVAFSTTIPAAFTVTCAAVTGRVRVTTTTTGADIDPDGYTVTVDGGGGQLTPVNGVVTMSGLSPGVHSIALAAVSVNCTVGPPNPSSVSVTAGATAVVDFAVSCVATNGRLRVITSTTGAHLDRNGYNVLVDEICDPYYGCYHGWSEWVTVNDTVVITGVPQGDHTVQLADLATNCTVAGPNSVTAAVPLGDTATVAYAVTCAPAGAVSVRTITTGVDPDLGYTVQLDSVVYPSLPANGVVTIYDVSEGDHAIQLGDVSANCQVAGNNPDTVHVIADDTARTTFQVTCVSRLGTLEVALATSGADLDADGYTVLVDYYCDYYYGCYYGWSVPAAANDTIRIPDVPMGTHSVWLIDVRANCTIAGPNPATATVTPGDTGRVAFGVTCAPVGAVEATAATNGVDPDPNGYTVQVDGGTILPVPTNGVVTFNDLTVGDHTVLLGDVASNCAVAAANPRTLTVTQHDTARTTFQVNCVSKFGTLAVTVATSGVNLDPDGYTVLVDYYCDYYYGCYYGWSVPVAVNDTIAIPNVPIGGHSVLLSDMKPNCTVTGPNPATVFVPSAGTGSVTLQVTCVP